MTVTDPPTALPRLDAAGRSLLFTSARTANTFAPTPVSDDELVGIWELAKWAPTAANSQPLRAVFVRTPEGKARLLPHLDEGNRAKAESAAAVAILARDARFHEHLPTVLPYMPQLKDVFAQHDELREVMSTTGATLQAAYFILAVRAQGLAAGPMAGFNNAGVDAEFFPDGRLRSVLVVNVGHPGANPWFDRLPRLGDSEVLSWA